MHKVYVCNHGHVHGAVEVIVHMSFSSYYSSTHNCRMEKAQRLLIPCHHPLLPQYNWSRDVSPCPPQHCLCSTPTPPQTTKHPPARSPPHLPTSLPDSMCKSAPWMMDYCVTAACEGLICFIDFSLGRMPASAASHLFLKTRSCNRR